MNHQCTLEAGAVVRMLQNLVHLPIEWSSKNIAMEMLRLILSWTLQEWFLSLLKLCTLSCTHNDVEIEQLLLKSRNTGALHQ